MMDVQPVTLRGKHVRLEPLDERHAADLFAAGADPEIWNYMFFGPFQSVDEVQAWVRETQARQTTGAEVPFAIVDLASGQAVGSTRYM